jgi:hypothetical protein
VQVLDDLTGKPLVQFLLRVEEQSLPLSSFFASSHESRIFVTFEETWNLGIGQESVHALQETRVQNVGFIHDEANLLTLATTTAQDITEIVVEILPRVFAVDLNLEDLQAVHPSNKPRKSCLKTLAAIQNNNTTGYDTFPEPETPIKIK